MKLDYATPRRFLVTHIWPKRNWLTRQRSFQPSARGAAYGLLASIFICGLYAAAPSILNLRWPDYAWCVLMAIPPACMAIGAVLCALLGD